MPTEDNLLEFVSVIAAVVVMGFVIVAANIADRDRNARLGKVVAASLIITNLLIILVYGAMQLIQVYGSADDATDLPTRSEAWAAFFGSLVVGGLAIALTNARVRRAIAVLFPRAHSLPLELSPTQPVGAPLVPSIPSTLTPQDGQPLFPQILNYYTDALQPTQQAAMMALSSSAEVHSQASESRSTRGFDPHSAVHMVALILIIDMLGIQFIDFFLAGGLAGVAEDIEGNINGWSLVINMLPLVLLPVMGVGFLTRRTARATLDRLGIGLPTAKGMATSLGLTVLLFAFVALVSSIWMGVVSEETFKEQTEASDALSSGVTTLGLAFLLALVAAVGEELAFRGALQPVFGFWPTALIFALTHAQYTLTPAWLIIFGVALGFGWIRRRYNTTVAMMTHFAYNFIPLAIAVYMPEQVAALIPWL